MSNIGIMDPAFFVGKVVLLKWLNEFFDAGYTKVEQTCTGAMHCQILDAIYPGKVPLGKVNFDAKTEYEYVANFKVLQNVFDKEQIIKHVDVQRLIKGKFQDNLEMLQWMKHFFDTHYGGQPYNAKERREEARAQYRKVHKHAGTGVKRAVTEGAAAKPAARTTAAVSKPAAAPAARAAPAVRTAAAKPAAAKPAARSSASSTSSSSNADVAELTSKLSNLTVTIEGLEKERDFYFGKLREIEILCQDADPESGAPAADVHPDVAAFKASVLAILYATDDNAEFQVPENEGEEQQGEEAQAEEDNQAGEGEEELLAGDEAGLLGNDELNELLPE